MLRKSSLKDLLGEIPFTAEIYWHLRQSGKPIDPHFSLKHLEEHLADWVTIVRSVQPQVSPGKKVAIFGVLRYWIEHTTLLGLTLAGLGHKPALAFLPYDHWKKTLNRFDLRRQSAYARSVLQHAEPVLDITSLVDVKPERAQFPPALQEIIDEVAYRDTQYSLQIEDVARDHPLYHLRQTRNTQAALAGGSLAESGKSGCRHPPQWQHP